MSDTVGLNLNSNAKRLALLGSAAAIALFAMPMTAQAQDSAADDAPSTKASRDSGAMDDVIIVMARRQAETLQEVPVTITSIGGELLEKYNVNEVSDVVSRVPTLNVQVGGSGSGGQLSLRGVGSSNISAAFDSAVAFDFDGVQISTMRMVQAGFIDTKQIDVLKGPQSLYFGKSASAGVISIRSQDPTPDWEVGGKASYEIEEDGWTVGGYISGPLTPTLGVRIAAEYNDIKDFVTLQPGTPAVNQQRGLKNTFVRGTLAWEPVSGFSANLKVQYFHNQNDGAIGHSDIYCGANGIADPVVLLGSATVPFSVVIPAGYDCKAFDNKIFLPDTAPPLAQSVPTASGPSKAVGYNGVPFGETDLFFGRLLLNFELSDNLTFTSTTGFVDLDSTDVDNYSYGGVGPAYSPLGPLSAIAPALAAANGAGVPLGVGTSDPRNTLKQYSQEMRFTSNFDGMFNFMVGGLYEWRKFGFDTAQNGINISMIAPDPVTGFTFDWDKNQITKTDAYSGFGSVMLALSDQLELSGGIRYTKETKVSRIYVPYVHAFLAASPAFLSSGFFSGPINFSDSNWSPEATLKYQINPDVNVFASFKTGFKSGGIDNSALPSNSLSQAAISGDFSSLIFKSEKAIGGEVGLKSQFADRTITFNATAYYYKFDDLQVQNFDPIAVQFVTLNAGQVTTKGLDIGWGWRTPLEGFNLSGNLSLLDAKFTKSFVTAPGVDLNGRDAAQAPTLSGNVAFDWSVPVGNSLQIDLNGNARYSGSYITAQTSPNDYRQKSYVTFDGRISVGDPDGRWKVSVIGVNLTDKIFVTSAGGRPFLPGANSFGIPVGDDVILSTNRGRQVFLETSFRF